MTGNDLGGGRLWFTCPVGHMPQPSPRERTYETGAVVSIRIDDVTSADGTDFRRELRVFMRGGRVVSERLTDQELTTTTGDELMESARWYYGREPRKRRGVTK
jgi:hypothetical protein